MGASARHAKETGPKGCTLVTVENGAIAAVEHRSVDVLRWAALEIDACDAEEDGDTTLGDLESRSAIAT